MKSLIMLKILCQLSFYFAVTSFVVGIFSGANLISIFPLVVGILFARCWVKPKGAISYLPLLFLGLCFLIVPLDLLHLVAIVPIIIYAIFAPYYLTEQNAKKNCHDNFKRALITFVTLAIFAILYTFTPLGEFIQAILIGNYVHGSTRHPNTPLGFYIWRIIVNDAIAVFFRTILPLAICYLWSGLMFLRTQEYEVETTAPRQLKIINATSLLRLIIGIVIVSIVATFLISLIELPTITFTSARDSCPTIVMNQDQHWSNWSCNNAGSNYDGFLEPIFTIVDGVPTYIYPVECWCPQDARLNPESPLYIGDWTLGTRRIEVTRCSWHFVEQIETFIYLITDDGRVRYLTESGIPVQIDSSMISCHPTVDEDFTANRNPQRNAIILTAFGITIIGGIIFFLIKNRPRFNKINPRHNEDIEEIRTAISEPKSTKNQTRRWNDNQVRAVYQKFLNELIKNDITVQASMTSFDIEELTKTDTKMRAIYTKVRYAEAKYSKEEVKQIKQIYRKLRAELRQRK